MGNIGLGPSPTPEEDPVDAVTVDEEDSEEEGMCDCKQLSLRDVLFFIVIFSYFFVFGCLICTPVSCVVLA